MAVTYGFYDSLAGDRKYNADQISSIFEGIVTEGIFQSLGDSLMVVEKAGMEITVGTGRCWFQNTWTKNDADLDLTVDPSTFGLNRIDCVVVEVNKNVATRANSIKIVKGVETSVTPVPPTMTHTSTVNQYPLCNIYIGSGVTAITTADITNRRGTIDCPFITGILETIDLTTLLAQYEAEFDIWFQDLQNNLDSSQASNLQNQINDLENGWINPGETWTYASADAPTFTFTISGDKTSIYSKGMRLKLTQSSTVKYFIVTNVAYSSPNTTVTVYGGTDYTLTNNTITLNRYSMDKVPYGFPVDPLKWTVSLVQGANVTQTNPNPSQYYNLGLLSLVMPIGSWVVRMQGTGYIDKGSAATMIMQFGISTSSTSVSDTSLTGEWAIGSIALLQQPFAISPMPITRSAKATYYFIGMTGTSGVSNLIAKNIVVQFVCGYL